MTASLVVDAPKPPQTKQVRFDDSLRIQLLESTDAEDDGTKIRAHPLRVRPSGNALTSTKDLRGMMGPFGMLPDDLVLSLLEWLDANSLQSVGASCRGLFAYSSYDQLWKDLYLRGCVQKLTWRGSWRASVLLLPSADLPTIDCNHLFSDALHRPFLCSEVPLSPYASNIPPANQIARFSDLSPQEFDKDWANKPFILTQPVKQWDVYQKWDISSLLRDYEKVVFRAEAVDWPFRTYFDYMNHNLDESPLYLFDRAFVSKMELEVGPCGAYFPPTCFGEDLFQLLGRHRPDHRWLIIGPARSGSTFHKDPNATSAWNAVIRGSKYWIMFPCSVQPPGVFMSNDQSEVTSPLSIAEWLLAFHEEGRNTPGCVEGICHEGEVLHVPSGWWHLVVNLEPAIAITQNFVPKAHLHAALKFLKEKPNQVSGFSTEVQDPHELFLVKLKMHHAELLPIPAAEPRKRKWDSVLYDAANGDLQCAKTFSFGFAADDEEEERP